MDLKNVKTLSFPDIAKSAYDESPRGTLAMSISGNSLYEKLRNQLLAIENYNKTHHYRLIYFLQTAELISPIAEDFSDPDVGIVVIRGDNPVTKQYVSDRLDSNYSIMIPYEDISSIYCPGITEAHKEYLSRQNKKNDYREIQKIITSETRKLQNVIKSVEIQGTPESYRRVADTFISGWEIIKDLDTSMDVESTNLKTRFVEEFKNFMDFCVEYMEKTKVNLWLTQEELKEYLDKFSKIDFKNQTIKNN